MGITAAGLAADPNAQRSLARLNAAVKSKDNWFGVLLDQIRTYTSPLQLAASEIKDKNLTKAALSEELVAAAPRATTPAGFRKTRSTWPNGRRPRSGRSSPAAGGGHRVLGRRQCRGCRRRLQRDSVFRARSRARKAA